MPPESSMPSHDWDSPLHRRVKRRRPPDNAPPSLPGHNRSNTRSRRSSAPPPPGTSSPPSRYIAASDPNEQRQYSEHRHQTHKNRQRGRTARIPVSAWIAAATLILGASAAAAVFTLRSDDTHNVDSDDAAHNNVDSDDDSGNLWELLARSIVLVYSNECGQLGSGTIISDGGFVLTNSHVVNDDEGRPCEMAVGLTDSFNETPDRLLYTELILDDKALDLAALQLVFPDDATVNVKNLIPISIKPVDLQLGEKVTVLGYPNVGGLSLTLTSGNYSGNFDDGSGHPYLKTDASLNSGVSGGAAFDSAGRFVGVSTAAVSEQATAESEQQDALGLIRPASTVAEFLARLPVD